ncbi:RagB/SusD family nutrient uptake outer membrane protein [Pedobacter ginsenosidimutans]|nr:RagB/SusD family nutrient uptake outer membrane protein [Pedobacter ginsenosidimutans]
MSYNYTAAKTRCLFVIVVIALIELSGCKKYLDVVPDNVATIENAFKLRNEAEKYLFTCYSYLPKNGDNWYNAGMFTAAEIIVPEADQSNWHAAYRIARGQQNKDAPLFDEWGGARKGNPGNTRFDHLKIWRAIRHCNIFLENIQDRSKVPDLSLDERTRWIGEVKFLKAYYHFYMLQMYGPIPIVDKNLDGEDMLHKRMPVDECVNFISALLDESVEGLPSRIVDENTQLGRVTQPIALAVKAKLLVLAASPLFNGNPDYLNFKDNDGTSLFNSTFDAGKWVKARDASKAAVEAALQNGHQLYEYRNDIFNLSPETKVQLNIRNAVTDRWNTEVVWGLSNSYFGNEGACMPPMVRGANINRGQLQGKWAASMSIAKMFYTKNGVPLEEDKTLNFSNYTALRTAIPAERYNIEGNYPTARLNFDREPRFYADLGFDGGVWYMKDGNATGSDINTFYVQSKNSNRAGFGDFVNWNETGYFIKKLVHWESTTNSSAAPTWRTFPWPEIRLADLYLLYAESINEVEGGSSTAIEYLNRVRKRAGLNGVVESWSAYSNNPSKFSTKAGLREIIQRERLIELAFEGQRFWDIRRWKLASTEFNRDITALNIYGKTSETYNVERVVWSMKFIAPRDYLWPIGNYEIRRNAKLVENPGW